MRRLILVLVFLVIILGGTTFYFYKNSGFSKLDPKSINENELKTITEKVGKLVILPTGEVPTLATVTDLEPLKGQAFFIDAKKGDKVLIFKSKAILYDPNINKIVNIAPVNQDDNIGNKQSVSDNPTIPTSPIIKKDQ